MKPARQHFHCWATIGSNAFWAIIGLKAYWAKIRRHSFWILKSHLLAHSSRTIITLVRTVTAICRFYFELALDWLGVIQPFVSLRDTDDAIMCAPSVAPSVVDSLWAGFVRSNSYSRFKTDTLVNGQPHSLALQPPASLMCSSATICAYSSSALVTSPPVSLPRELSSR
ncbi:uncharacterized protein LOC111831250 isoform X3 [Capsella rubella]|uniref:uncharacterized protein LOC111831250 isoform X3 n=1 Tax=Capsella rubella TaxID=81985 RepID=UPI000CD5BDB9|nr:uncharacterized protein LOC111831250 isoform X3 [Capsella rubella]